MIFDYPEQKYIASILATQKPLVTTIQTPIDVTVASSTGAMQERDLANLPKIVRDPSLVEQAPVLLELTNVATDTA